MLVSASTESKCLHEHYQHCSLYVYILEYLFKLVSIHVSYKISNIAHLQIRILASEMVIGTEVDSNQLNLALKIFYGVDKKISLFQLLTKILERLYQRRSFQLDF